MTILGKIVYYMVWLAIGLMGVFAVYAAKTAYPGDVIHILIHGIEAFVLGAACALCSILWGIYTWGLNDE